MDFAELRFWSASQDRWARMAAFIPPGRGPHPVVLLLHGLGGDSGSWALDYDVHPLFAPLRSIVIMPDAGNGYYVDDPRPAGCGRTESLVLKDVLGCADRVFHTRKDPAHRSVAGISMGGYGALMLALRHPDTFGRAAALSPSLYFGHSPHPRGAARQDHLASALPDGEYDCFQLAARHAPGVRRPDIWLSVGRSDAHLATCRSFHDRLEALRWPHVYREAEGGHDRAFWARELPAMVEFLNTRPIETAGPTAERARSGSSGIPADTPGLDP